MLRERVREALERSGVPAARLEVPRNPAFGDLAVFASGSAGESPLWSEARREGGFLNLVLSPAARRSVVEDLIAHGLRLPPGAEEALARLPVPLDPGADPTLANPAVRVRYAVQRARSVLRMARDQGVACEPGDPDREMVRALEDLPWALARAAERGDGRAVALQVLALADRYHALHARPILKDPALVALSAAVLRALEGCCRIMGMEETS